MGLQVVGHVAALGDDPAYGGLDTVGGLDLSEMAQHQHAAQDCGCGVGLVLPGVFGGRAVHRLEHRRVLADVGPRRDPQAAHQPGAQVAEDVAEEVGGDNHVVLLRTLHQLHAHVVHDAIVELDVGVLLRHLARRPQEQPIGQFEDVALVHRCHLTTAIGASVLEGKAHDALAGTACDQPDRFSGLVGDDDVLDPGIEPLGILAHYDQINVPVWPTHTVHGPGRAQVGV